MNYLKSIKLILSFFLCISLLSGTAQAELKPYTANYTAYSNGFQVGETSQTLIKLGDLWLMKLTTEATGFASFFQSKAATQQQVFKTKQNQPVLISAISDSGKSKENAKKQAYYDETIKKLLIRVGDKTKSIPISQPFSTYLLLPISAVNMPLNTPLDVKLYDKGTIKTMLMDAHKTDDKLIVDVYSEHSNKRLRYIFKDDNKRVPYRIERFKNNELKAYLELSDFKL